MSQMLNEFNVCDNHKSECMALHGKKSLQYFTYCYMWVLPSR